MQTREQWKGSRNWKLVTGAAAAATLGLGALAIAIPGDADAAPPSISLDERTAVSMEATAGGFVPFDLGTFIGLHAPNQIGHSDPYFGDVPFWDTRPFSADSRADQTGAVVAPPVGNDPAKAVSDGVAPADDGDEPTSDDVLSGEAAETTTEVTDDGVSDDAVTDGPAVTIADDPLSNDDVSDDAPDLPSDDSPTIGDDSNDSIPDDAVTIIVDESNDSVPEDPIPDDSLDSPDDSD